MITRAFQSTWVIDAGPFLPDRGVCRACFASVQVRDTGDVATHGSGFQCWGTGSPPVPRGEEDAFMLDRAMEIAEHGAASPWWGPVLVAEIRRLRKEVK